MIQERNTNKYEDNKNKQTRKNKNKIKRRKERNQMQEISEEQKTTQEGRDAS